MVARCQSEPVLDDSLGFKLNGITVICKRVVNALEISTGGTEYLLGYAVLGAVVMRIGVVRTLSRRVFRKMYYVDKAAFLKHLYGLGITDAVVVTADDDGKLIHFVKAVQKLNGLLCVY